MVAVQSTGCGPIVRAFEGGADAVAEPWPDPDTRVHGVRVPKPLGDRLILAAIRESNGFASAVDDDAVDGARAAIAREHGLHLCPEGAACYVACMEALEIGRVDAADRVVLFNTASGLKEPMPAFR
jgi:threonine synthase